MLSELNINPDDLSTKRQPWYAKGYLGQYFNPNFPAGGGGPGKFVSPTILGFDGSASDSRFHPLSPASRYLTDQDYQKHFEGANFNIAKIPGLMSSKGWPVGTALMSSWFARSPRIAPDYDPPEVALVSVDWILKFDRARSQTRIFDDGATSICTVGIF